MIFWHLITITDFPCAKGFLTLPRSWKVVHSSTCWLETGELTLIHVSLTKPSSESLNIVSLAQLEDTARNAQVDVDQAIENTITQLNDRWLLVYLSPITKSLIIIYQTIDIYHTLDLHISYTEYLF